MATEVLRGESGLRGSNIDALFHPSSVAVVGATPKQGHVGYVIMVNLLGKFKGKVFLVNPRYDSINGVKCYKGLTDVDDEVDLAVIAVRPPWFPRWLRMRLRRGLRL
jgi:Acyl-CoA synthetase (NDP forming)